MIAVVVGTAVGVFLATNVDTFVVVAALFATHPTASATIAGGQFLGFAAVVAVAVAIAAGLDHFESRWFALFGYGRWLPAGAVCGGSLAGPTRRTARPV